MQLCVTKPVLLESECSMRQGHMDFLPTSSLLSSPSLEHTLQQPAKQNKEKVFEAVAYKKDKSEQHFLINSPRSFFIILLLLCWYTMGYWRNVCVFIKHFTGEYMFTIQFPIFTWSLWVYRQHCCTRNNKNVNSSHLSFKIYS